MSLVRATLRLQLSAGFTFADVRQHLSYFSSLGISHLYLSPVSTARPGSTHGYDVIDHSAVSPALGGEHGLRALAESARAFDIGIVLDIVPNHMAAHPDNVWWADVLRHGLDSPYASWFDIDWSPPVHTLQGRVLAPFLSGSCRSVLAAGRIRLALDEYDETFFIEAEGMRYPIAPGSLEENGEFPQDTLKLYENNTLANRHRLEALLARQHYRLSGWRLAARCINWRRFFEINDLIGVRVEEPSVFDAVHALTLRLYEEGVIDGVRIDHVDGLADPSGYCRRLREALDVRTPGRPEGRRHQQVWLVVEKILAADEHLPDSWKADGTTGYDFMDQVSAVLHDACSETALTHAWQEVSGDPCNAAEQVWQVRRRLLRRHFVAERRTLLKNIEASKRFGGPALPWGPSLTAAMLDGVLCTLPVYRSYIDLNTMPPGPQREAVKRFQQLTPPLAAKSQEDTVFYRYGRLISRNEVGSDPDTIALSPSAFHSANVWRARHAPRSMLATATHDHKRGEDVRARLAVLSEIPAAWIQASRSWLHRPGLAFPLTSKLQAGERYILFQTMVGAWPLDLSPDDHAGLLAYVQRLAQWRLKALREAKQSSDWLVPDRWYEQKAEDYLVSLVLDRSERPLIGDIGRFAASIAPSGVMNSLAQTLLRLTVPGVPDLYQGAEGWDLSLVDPDNRRPVDFTARSAMLALLDATTDLAQLLPEWRTGAIKQALIARVLGLRRKQPELFDVGGYLPLDVSGARKEHALAFLRTWRDQSVVVIVPRVCAEAVMARVPALPMPEPAWWQDTAVTPPTQLKGARFADVLAGSAGKVLTGVDADGRLLLSDVLSALPVAVLRPTAV
ncbi:malto-oligosyltrehalose synthase [Pusillimonas sp. ANT_WB101]|uniref:malto-oligosyltrehalose synthase n=1 Tax=Pusillimonas sp. ANT_WB101 TaxID=2597356 RepID=UPI0011EDFC7D|nr:malto-oligosyltrehalose synthase [Pusillimonas sp. ANT_WB101]KAA0890741.1 malto-oligosyltrehalose synthase [Pusillimonas sp. ANT_WB101]